VLTTISETSSTDSTNLNPRSPAWSKEALFGLLGVLVVVIVPCIGLLLRFYFARQLNHACSKETTSERVRANDPTSKLNKPDLDRDIESCHRGARRDMRRNWRTGSRSGKRTVVFVL